MILIAADAFKDALPAREVCAAIEKGVQLTDYQGITTTFPLADGGEGTAEILTRHAGGAPVETAVSDPVFRPVRAHYGRSADGKIAFMDMASAAGLQWLAPSERNPLETTTYGVGEMIRAATLGGAEKIILGIGGSATNDAGMGMAAALGIHFLDEKGRRLRPVGKNLKKVARIDDTDFFFHPKKIKRPVIEVLCDVQNPLFGPDGAAFVYAPQKGATPDMVRQLDEGLRHFARVLEAHFGRDFARIPGAGAAGGLGAGLLAFLNADLKKGIETILDLTGFDTALAGAELLLTGEGRLDAQTAQGKLIAGLCRHATRFGVPVIALCGALDARPDDLRRLGLTAAFSILNRPVSLKEALAQTADGLENLAFRVVQTWLAGKKKSG